MYNTATISLFVLLEVRQFRLDPIVQQGGMRTIESYFGTGHSLLTVTMGACKGPARGFM